MFKKPLLPSLKKKLAGYFAWLLCLFQCWSEISVSKLKAKITYPHFLLRE